MTSKRAAPDGERVERMASAFAAEERDDSRAAQKKEVNSLQAALKEAQRKSDDLSIQVRVKAAQDSTELKAKLQAATNKAAQLQKDSDSAKVDEAKITVELETIRKDRDELSRKLRGYDALLVGIEHVDLIEQSEKQKITSCLFVLEGQLKVGRSLPSGPRPSQHNGISCDYQRDSAGNFVMGRDQPYFVILIGTAAARQGYWYETGPTLRISARWEA